MPSGRVCVDLDECLSANGGCSPNATCTNTVGSRTCACRPGYMGDGVSCADVDECQTNNGGCGPTAQCVNTPGSSFCRCPQGTVGDGGVCTAVTNGEVCETAIPIQSAQTLSGTTVGAVANYSGFGVDSICDNNNHQDVVYVGTVPAGRRGTFAVSSTHRLDLVAEDAQNCNRNPRVCLMGDSPGFLGLTAASVRFTNGASSPQPAFAIVGAGTAGSFSVRYDVDTPPAGDTCSTASTISPGTLNGQTFTGLSYDYECPPELSSNGDADRVYRVVLPPSTRLRAEVTPTGYSTATLGILGGPASICDSMQRSCLSSSRQANMAMSVVRRFGNFAQTSREVFIVTSGPSNGSFSLATATSTILPGDACQNALPLPLGTSTVAFSGFGVDHPFPQGRMGCAQATTIDRAFQVTVPAGQLLTVVADVPAGGGIFSPGVDVGMNLVAGTVAACDTGACLASADMGGNGVDETLTWRNSGTTAATVFLIFTDFSSASMPSAQLTVTIQ